MLWYKPNNQISFCFLSIESTYSSRVINLEELELLNKEISNNESFFRRRNLVVKHLNETPGLSCRTPEGAFYVFASCKGVLGKKTESGKILNTDGDFMDYLLGDVGVAGVQGSAFGLEGFFRISYATSDSILEDACQRIKNACSRLS